MYRHLPWVQRSKKTSTPFYLLYKKRECRLKTLMLSKCVVALYLASEYDLLKQPVTHAAGHRRYIIPVIRGRQKATYNKRLVPNTLISASYPPFYPPFYLPHPSSSLNWLYYHGSTSTYLYVKSSTSLGSWYTPQSAFILRYWSSTRFRQIDHTCQGILSRLQHCISSAWSPLKLVNRPLNSCISDAAHMAFVRLYL